MLIAFHLEVRYNCSWNRGYVMDLKKIQDVIKKKDFFPRIVLLIFGIFLLALNYNLFLLPNHLVIGGTTGLSIVFESLFGWNPTIFLYVSTGILMLVSFLFLGFKQTSASIIGSILYPFFVTLTFPLSEILKNYVQFDNVILLILAVSILFGCANGIIYKVGFDTGGSDIVMRILHKYCHMPEGKSAFATQIFIILFGGFVFGVSNFIYAILILVIYTSIVDKIIIGISDSKLFFIYTKKWEEVENYILNELHTGVTILETEGGYSKEKNNLLMCVVPNKDYFLFKEVVLQIDQKAFFVINDCYEVKGGLKRKNLPFL